MGGSADPGVLGRVPELTSLDLAQAAAGFPTSHQHSSFIGFVAIEWLFAYLLCPCHSEP